MLLLGHTGITLGAAVMLDATLREMPLLQPSAFIALPDPPSNSKTSWFASLANHTDIRILLVGSLLPDIIDKPVGQILFRGTFSNGRICCHTLLFLLVITLAGLYLYKKRQGKTWLLTFSFSTSMHLILDQMWLSPLTLLWPIYGVAFPKVDLTHWLEDTLASLTMPSVYVPEVIGALVLGIFLWQVIGARTLGSFIKRGSILN